MLDDLEKSVASLVSVCAKSADAAFMEGLDEVARNAVLSGVIRHFEHTYELCWKAVKQWIETHVSPVAASGITRRELFRQAKEHLLIDDVELWMRYHAAKNETVLSADPPVALSAYGVINQFAGDAVSLKNSLAVRNRVHASQERQP